MASDPSPGRSTLPRGARIYVAGHRGLVGSALVRRLQADGHHDLITADRSELDLRDQAATEAFFAETRPEYVFMAAGTVGGLAANLDRAAEFLYDNLMITSSVIHAAHKGPATKKLLFVGPASLYPATASQPIEERELLRDALAPVHEGYALAGIIGVKLCTTYRRQYGRNFISAIATNVYGPGDTFDPATAPVVPALIRRCHDAKVAGVDQVEVWGTGRAHRDLLHVDDLADACVVLMDRYDQHGHVNIGSGHDTSVRTLAETIRDVVHPTARLAFDPTRPEGSPRRLLDTTRIGALGWRPRIPLAAGLADTYRWFLDHVAAREAAR